MPITSTRAYFFKYPFLETISIVLLYLAIGYLIDPTDILMIDKQFNLSFGGGYGGTLFGRDHLSIGFNYNQSVNGTQENTLEIYTNYHLFF